MVRVAVAQIDPHLADKRYNLEIVEQSIADASRAGTSLIVLPEAAVTGYVYESLDEARAVAESIPGPTTESIAAATERHHIFAVVGMLERVGPDVFNTAILCGPRGLEAVYRKTHTLCLGVDRFTAPGDLPYVVHPLPFLRLGILICYDLRFPEPARALALGGAQAIALPTNWPASSTIQPEIFTRARAAENRVFVLAADRIGQERDATFLGRSQIVDPNGVVLAEASTSESEMVIRDIDPAGADRKHVVLRAGAHEMDCFADRRPELYAAIAERAEPAPA